MQRKAQAGSEAENPKLVPIDAFPITQNSLQATDLEKSAPRRQDA
jgi:hypothetical protein